MHPCDDANALVSGTRIQADRLDAFGGLRNGLVHDPDRNGWACVETGRNLAGVLGDLLERLVPI